MHNKWKLWYYLQCMYINICMYIYIIFNIHMYIYTYMHIYIYIQMYVIFFHGFFFVLAKNFFSSRIFAKNQGANIRDCHPRYGTVPWWTSLETSLENFDQPAMPAMAGEMGGKNDRVLFILKNLFLLQKNIYIYIGQNICIYMYKIYVVV